MNEFDIGSYKQYADGEAMMVVDGKRFRYRGVLPRTLNPFATVNLGTAMLQLTKMCKTIPLEAPWDARKAGKWDSITVALWLDHHVLSVAARDLLETAIGGTYTSDTSEISLLFALHQMASGGGPDFMFGIEGGPRTPESSAALGRSTGRWPRSSTIGTPGAAGARYRPGRRRGDGAVRRHDGAGAARGRRRADRHREPDPL
jgi:monoamine oxidase